MIDNLDNKLKFIDIRGLVASLSLIAYKSNKGNIIPLIKFGRRGTNNYIREALKMIGYDIPITDYDMYSIKKKLGEYLQQLLDRRMIKHNGRIYYIEKGGQLYKIIEECKEDVDRIMKTTRDKDIYYIYCIEDYLPIPVTK